MHWDKLLDHPLRKRDNVSAHLWPIASVRGLKLFREAMAEVHPEGVGPASYMLYPSATSAWSAILDEDPYPVKAAITQGTNALVSFANSRRIHQAMTSDEPGASRGHGPLHDPDRAAGRLRDARHRRPGEGDDTAERPMGVRQCLHGHGGCGGPALRTQGRLPALARPRERAGTRGLLARQSRAMVRQTSGALRASPSRSSHRET